MRAAAVLLLLANIGCAIWFGWLAPPQPAARPVAGGDLRPVTGQPAGGGQCFALQPPPGADEGQRLAYRLRARVARVDWQPPRTTTEYWVHQAPFDDLEQARGAVRALQRDGFDQAALATGRGWTNVVVLGVFDQKDNATDRRDALRAEDVEALISERERELRPGRLVIRANRAPSPPQGHQWVARDCAR